MSPAPPFTAPAEAPITARLRILATSDLHVHVRGYDYYADAPSEAVGLARTARLIAEARAEVANTLLVDNGDFLQGNPMGDFIAQSPSPHAPRIHPVFAAMNRLGYDAATLGNHEFNYGLEFLLHALQGAAFPVVSANLARRLGASPEEDEPLLPPHVLLRRELVTEAGCRTSLTIGVIGFAPPQVTQWDRAHLEGRLFARDIVQSARALVPRLRAAGAEVVVALAHSGIGPAETTEGAENASTGLACIDGIDALISGHSHLVFPSDSFAGVQGADLQAGTLMGKPTVMPGFYGSHLGVIDLMLTKGAEGWRATGGCGSARPVHGLRPCPEAPDIARIVEADHRATLAYARRPIGQTATALTSFFAAVAPSPVTRLVAEAQANHVRRQLAGRPEAALPVLSAAAPFKSGGRGGPGNYTVVPPGDMALRHAADLYIFPNTIAALRMTGAQIADWLENAVGLYRRILPDEADQPLIDPEFPSYNQDLIHGLSFRIDLARPARFDRHGQLVQPLARRVRDLCWRGAPLDPTAEFILATNSYRASGCGGFSGGQTGNAIDVGRAPIREILLRHIAEASPILPLPAADWQLAPLPAGASVTFDTSPAAIAHLTDIASLSPEPLGLTAEGFARFRLRF